MTYGIYRSVAFSTVSGTAVAPFAAITVRREVDGTLAAIYSDIGGTVPITQPGFIADALGRFEFYAPGIALGYDITVSDGVSPITLNNQPVGTFQYQDNPITSKGDLLVAAAAGSLTRKAAGANGTLLAPDSAQADGLVWAALGNLAMQLNTLNAIPRSHVGGLTYDNGTGGGAGDLVNDITINVGEAVDSANVALLKLSAAITKQLDVAWAVGTNQGGILSGAAANVDYNIWLIRRPDTGVVDVGFETTANATPTLPANYTQYRKIGWFKRVAATIVAFHTYETEGGGLEKIWDVPTLDINLANTLSQAKRTDAVKVPLNFSTVALINVEAYDAASSSVIWVFNPDHTGGSDPSLTVAPLGNMRTLTSLQSAVSLEIRTSSAGLIASRADITTVDEFRVVTRGFKWARRN